MSQTFGQAWRNVQDGTGYVYLPPNRVKIGEVALIVNRWIMPIIDEWSLGDDAGWQSEETVAPKRPGRRLLVVLAILIALGAGLSMQFRSVERVSLEQPTLTPAATPALDRLTETVVRESLALNRRDREAFLAIQDIDDIRWHDSQRAFFDSWEPPSFDGVPYFIVDAGLMSGRQAWVDVQQLRGNGYTRETRFYREVDGEWKRTRPVLSFWGRERTLDTVHFHAIYADGDQDVVQYMLARFEAAYSKLCVDLGCPIRSEQSTKYGTPPEWYSPYPINYSPYPRVLSITLVMRPELDRNAWEVVDAGQMVTITLPSPRVSGVLDGWLGHSVTGSIEPMDLKIADSLVAPVVRVISGGTERWQRRPDGQLFLDAVVAWERDVLQPLSTDRLRYVSTYGSFDDADLLPPEMLWNWPREFVTDERTLAQMREQALSIVVFIGREFGSWGLGGFTRALGASFSLEGAIQGSLRMDYASFERMWRDWLKEK